MHQIVPGNEYSLAPEAYPVLILHRFTVLKVSERADGKAGSDLTCQNAMGGNSFRITVDQHSRITRDANRAFLEEPRGHHRHAAGHQIVPYQTRGQHRAQEKLL